MNFRVNRSSNNGSENDNDMMPQTIYRNKGKDGSMALLSLIVIYMSTERYLWYLVSFYSNIF